jgi:hypothetical protein
VLSEPRVGDGWEVVLEASANMLALVLDEQTLLVSTSRPVLGVRHATSGDLLDGSDAATRS